MLTAFIEKSSARSAAELTDELAGFLVSPEVLALLHLAIENELVDLRDEQIWVKGPANGFVIKTREGFDSDVIRLGTRDGLLVALRRFCGHDWMGVSE